MNLETHTHKELEVRHVLFVIYGRLEVCKKKMNGKSIKLQAYIRPHKYSVFFQKGP